MPFTSSIHFRPSDRPSVGQSFIRSYWRMFYVLSVEGQQISPWHCCHYAALLFHWEICVLFDAWELRCVDQWNEQHVCTWIQRFECLYTYVCTCAWACGHTFCNRYPHSYIHPLADKMTVGLCIRSVQMHFRSKVKLSMALLLLLFFVYFIVIAIWGFFM